MDGTGNTCDRIMALRKACKGGRSARGTGGSHHLCPLGSQHLVTLWAAKSGSCL